jgi:NCAIR mutase (PurE)-related protein
MKKPIVGFIAGVTAPPGKRMGHAGALISGGADTADAKLAIMEECGFKVTRNPSEMAKLLKALLRAKLTRRSLDNVLAVAAAAKGNLPLLVLGLLVSIPLIIFGATLLTKVMERFPIIITIGAALLGPGDLYMLCSDGLSEMVTDGQLFTLLGHDVELQKKASLLVAIANDNGGRDNISVVLARAGVAEVPRAAR